MNATYSRDRLRLFFPPLWRLIRVVGLGFLPASWPEVAPPVRAILAIAERAETAARRAELPPALAGPGVPGTAGKTWRFRNTSPSPGNTERDRPPSRQVPATRCAVSASFAKSDRGRTLRLPRCAVFEARRK